MPLHQNPGQKSLNTISYLRVVLIIIGGNNMSNNDSHSTSYANTLLDSIKSGYTSLISYVGRKAAPIIVAAGIGGALAGCGAIANNVRRELNEGDLEGKVQRLHFGDVAALTSDIIDIRDWASGRNRPDEEAQFTEEFFERLDDIQTSANTPQATATLHPGSYTPSGKDDPLTLTLNPANGVLEYHIRGQVEGRFTVTYDAHVRLIPGEGQLRIDYRLADENTPEDLIEARPVEVIRIEERGAAAVRGLVTDLIVAHLMDNPNFADQLWAETLDPFNERRENRLSQTASDYAHNLIDDKEDCIEGFFANPEDLPHGYGFRLNTGGRLLFRADPQPDAARPHQAGAWTDVLFSGNTRNNRDALMTLESRDSDGTTKRVHVIVNHDLTTGQDGATPVFLRGPYMESRTTYDDSTRSPVRDIRRLDAADAETFIRPLRVIMDGYRGPVTASGTGVPSPTGTEAPPPTGTEVPPPTGTEVPPPTGTEVPPPTGTEVPPPYQGE